MDRIGLSWPSRPGPRYLIALVAVLAGILARAGFASAGANKVPYVAFYPFIMLAAYLGGIGPGLLSVLLFAVAGALWLPNPTPVDEVSWVVFVVGAGLVAAASAAIRTSRQRAEQKTAELEAMFNSLRQPVIVFDDRGRPRRSNAAAKRVLGEDVTTLDPVGYGRRSQELRTRRPDGQPVSPEDLPSRRALRGQTVLNEEYILSNSSGHEVAFEISGIPFQAGGRILGAVAVLHDVTERRKVEEALRESEERLQMAQEAGGVGIFDWDIATNRVLWTRQLEETYGMAAPAEPAEARRAWIEHVHPEDRERLLKDIEQWLASGTDRREGEYRFIRPDGQERWIAGSSLAIRNADGRAVRIIGTNIDITERKRQEAELKRAGAAKDQFLAMLSHELRNPLTPVLAAASALEGDLRLPADVKEDAAMIRRNVELETRLIEDLLDLTRVARGKLGLQMQPVDVIAILREAVQICEIDLNAKDLRLTLDAKGAARAVHGDPARLQQVFWNLLKNAIKFTPPGGQIHIQGGAAEGRVLIRFRDSGEGIDPTFLPRIFEAFEQAEGATERPGGGLGLGLAICRALVKAHGGSIRAESPGKGQGATFTVELPLSEEPLPVEEPAAAPVLDGTSQARAHPLRILLVEDHADTARLMSRLLRASGYEVATAGSVASATVLARQVEYEVLVCDLGLPDGTGFDLLEQLKDHTGMKAIALSGHGTEEDIAKTKAAGFVEHLVKPIDVRGLQTAINRLMKPVLRGRGSH